MLHRHFSIVAVLVIAGSTWPTHAAPIDIGSAGNAAADTTGEVLATNWIRADNGAVAAAGGSETMFIGTASANATDFRGYLAFDLTQITGSVINSATVSIWSEGADTFDANGASTADANSIGLNLTSMLVEITGTTIDGTANVANYDNLVGGGDQYGAVIDTVTLNLDTIAVGTQVDFDVTVAIQAAIDANATKITFGLTSPDAIAAGNRNFFAFGGIVDGVDGTDIAPNLNVDFVPEPASLVLMGIGGIVLFRRGR